MCSEKESVKEVALTNQEKMIDIGDGIGLWVNCMGQGSPSIILESPGPGVDSSPWTAIQAQLAQRTYTCRYDRAGTGKSTGTELTTPTILPRTQDLEKLLASASIEPPYVMVGYSFGGAIVLRYAHQHLDRMAGLVLVESPTESILNSYANETPLTLPNTGRIPSLGNLPLAIITIDTQEYILPKPPNISSEEAMKVWQNTQSELVMLSEQGKQIFVKDTNHYNILDSHAEDVINAIMAIVEQHRKGGF